MNELAAFRDDDWCREEKRWDGELCRDPWPHGKNVKRITLALQGGGAHGAFTWGVLDRILEDDELAVEGISGTSAGALNGVVMAYGLTLGGRAEARRRLQSLWHRAASVASVSLLRPSFFDRTLGIGRMDFSLGFLALDMAGRLLSPYQFNPLNFDPLRGLVRDLVDFDHLRRCRALRLFVSATNVRRGRLRVFSLEEMSLDTVMASACLPFLQQAVEIEGEHYWDGGYLGNPALFPLVQHCGSRDLLLVQINPMNIDRVPTTAQEILDRINALTFNAGLLRELNAIHLMNEMLRKKLLSRLRYRPINLHVIEDEETMKTLGISSKLNADWPFLQRLHQTGRAAADRWLAEHRAALGKRSTISIPEVYL